MSERSGKPKRGEEAELLIESLDARGRGVGQIRDHEVLVPGALPGEVADVLVVRRAKGKVFGYRRGVITPSEHAVEPTCPHARSCGGCAFQHLAYSKQLLELHAQVRAAFASAGLETVTISAPVPTDPPWHYRNKIELSFGATRYVEPEEPEGAPRDFALGFHASGRFDRVLDLDRCEIAFEAATPILRTLRTEAVARGLPGWNPRRHEGLLRHAVLRHGFGTGETMLHLVTAPGREEELASYFAAILSAHPDIDTLIHGVSERVADISTPDRMRLVKGEGIITEELLGLRFRIGPLSFFQTNTRAAGALFGRLQERVREIAPKRIVDLYCGAGTIGLLLADVAEEVVGYELVPEAVADAERNAALNGISNARFVAGDVLKTAVHEERGFDAELLILDPPRSGLHPKVLSAVVAARPPRVAFVSCNPRVAAEQIATFVNAGYELESAELFDLFPHTPHVEGLFFLKRL